jgi:transposase-like protein
MILRFGLVEGGGQITTRALSSSNIAARPPYVLAIPQSLAQRKLIPRLHETRICVSRLHMPDINLFKQDHRTIRLCLGPMLGLKRFRCASITIAGIELTHRIKKGPFNLGKLRIRDKTAPVIWNAVLAT